MVNRVRLTLSLPPARRVYPLRPEADADLPVIERTARIANVPARLRAAVVDLGRAAFAIVLRLPITRRLPLGDPTTRAFTTHNLGSIERLYIITLTVFQP
jgi:hypothetical protein